MTGVELIAPALAGETTAGVSSTASAAVQDAYPGLRDLLRRRVNGRREGKHALDVEVIEPGVWQARLDLGLTETGADRDEEVLAAAATLLRMVDQAGAASCKYRVDARQAKGVQIGDHNTEHNTFS